MVSRYSEREDSISPAGLHLHKRSSKERMPGVEKFACLSGSYVIRQLMTHYLTFMYPRVHLGLEQSPLSLRNRIELHSKG